VCIDHALSRRVMSYVLYDRGGAVIDLNANGYPQGSTNGAMIVPR